MNAYRISDAARLLGVSDDTVRRWVDQGVLSTTGRTPVEIPGADLAAKAVELARVPGDPTDVPGAPDGRRVLGFTEKPDADTARAMIADGNYLWNAGIFLFTARTMIEAFRCHAPAYLDQVQAAIDKANMDLGFLRLAREPWLAAEDNSIDYAVMEKCPGSPFGLSMIALDAGWSDLGAWDAVWQVSEHDDAGNAVLVEDLASNARFTSLIAALREAGVGS